MLRRTVFSVLAAVVATFAVCADGVGQLYTSPTVSNLQSIFTPPTVDSYARNITLQRLNSGYGGVRSANIYSTLPGVSQTSGPPPSSAPRLGLGLGSNSRAAKPFTSYSSQPTVSPYLNLFRTDLQGGGNFNYSTLVQPQLQQQQINQQLERQAIQTSRRLQSIAAQPEFNPQGSKDQYPTGHQTVFNYWGRYYPQPTVRQKRTPGR